MRRTASNVLRSYNLVRNFSPLFGSHKIMSHLVYAAAKVQRSSGFVCYFMSEHVSRVHALGVFVTKLKSLCMK